MVLPLGPSKFYGKSLPRPRMYNDLKFNPERIDPPMGVTAPLLSWAKEASWSMGGLSHEKKRMAGKIEGSLKRLRDESEKSTRKQVREAKKRKKMQEKPEEKNEKESSGIKSHEDLESPKSKDFSKKMEKKPEDKKKKESSSVKSHEDLESPKSKDFSSPMPAQIFKPKWATDEDCEDCPLLVPDSIKRPVKKHSPKVRIRGRNLGHVYEADANGVHPPKGVSSDVGQKRLRAHSVAQYALKRQAARITQVYDYVPVPDKVMQMSIKRISPRRSNKEKKDVADSGSSVEFEPRSSDSIERFIRRSSRVLSYSPGPVSRGVKRIILSP